MASRALIDGDIPEPRIGNFVGQLKIKVFGKADTEPNFNARSDTVKLPPAFMDAKQVAEGFLADVTRTTHDNVFSVWHHQTDPGFPNGSNAPTFVGLAVQRDELGKVDHRVISTIHEVVRKY